MTTPMAFIMKTPISAFGCVRLATALHICPRSQIYHFTSSTFSRKRQAQIDYMRRNRTYFAKKHLGYGVRQAQDRSSWAGETRNPRAPAISVSAPFRHDRRQPSRSHDWTDWLHDSRLSPHNPSLPCRPQPWLGLRDRYRAVLSPSEAVVHSLQAAGFPSFRAPLGIDPDQFNPWGSVGAPAARRYDETTYLAIADNHNHRPFAQLLQAWSRFAVLGRRVRLIVVGAGLVRQMGRAADAAYRSGRFEISCYAEERLELHQTEAPLADEDLAILYRSVDFTIIAAAEGSSLTVLESLACGTPVVFDAACATVATAHHNATGGVATLHRDAAEPQLTKEIAVTVEGAPEGSGA